MTGLEVDTMGVRPERPDQQRVETRRMTARLLDPLQALPVGIGQCGGAGRPG